MAAINAPDFKLYELERKAEDALKRFPQCIRGLRVDIDLLIDLSGIHVESYFNLRRKWDTYAFPDIKGHLIYVDDDLLDDKQEEKKLRFTLAEEFAHVLIHTILFSECHTAEDRLSLHRRLGEDLVDRLDRQARALAGAMLMPASIFDPRVEDVATSCRNSNGEINVEELTQTLARDFDVNYRAARKRLKMRGYHREERLGLNLD
jgi:Zn-dependent peptidase ImmA (M78 family)